MSNIGKIILIAVLIIVGMVGCGQYNSLVTKSEQVNNAWSNVESAYQRRADLIPNLVETVKGYANFEQQTLTAVVEARSKATSTTIDPTNITPEKLAEYQQAQSGLSQALGRLLMITENYPELKANQNFLELQSQLEGTENRIKVERDKYNGVVTDYNIGVRKFPANLFAGLFGFKTRGQFEAEAGAEKAPQVKF